MNSPATARNIFVTGATGYIGQVLISRLKERGHTVRALVRKGSEHKIVSGIEIISGNPLDLASYADAVAPSDTFIHLVGVPHPSPAKARQFREVDLVSIRVGVEAAVRAGVRHFIYLSVAQPAPIMKSYIEVRAEGERLIRQSGLNATFLRPWYVLGPGHWWPLLFLPVYRLMEMNCATREAAMRLGLIRLSQMVNALIHATENPAVGVNVVDVTAMRKFK